MPSPLLDPGHSALEVSGERAGRVDVLGRGEQGHGGAVIGQRKVAEVATGRRRQAVGLAGRDGSGPAEQHVLAIGQNTLPQRVHAHSECRRGLDRRRHTLQRCCDLRL